MKVRQVIPVESVVVDTTVSPQTINLYINGVWLCVPMTDETHKLARAHPLKVQLVLETK